MCDRRPTLLRSVLFTMKKLIPKDKPFEVLFITIIIFTIITIITIIIAPPSSSQ